MWCLIGWFRCQACNALMTVANRALRSPYKRGFGVCQACYEAWERRGRRCARCWYAVRDSLQLAFLAERKAFGHFDCGGALLV